MPLPGSLSIKRKLTLLMMLTSSAVLLLACSAFVAYELITFRQTLTRDLSTLAEIIGTNSKVALAFNDQRYLDLWKTLEANPTNEEVIRNLPIRQPILWVD